MQAPAWSVEGTAAIIGASQSRGGFERPIVILKIINTSSEEILRRSPLHAIGEEALVFAEGFYSEEQDGGEPFRWMGLKGRLRCASSTGPGHVAEVSVFSQFFDLSQEMTITAGSERTTFQLLQGWSVLSCPVPEAIEQLDLEVNKLFPAAYYAGDERHLAIRVRSPRLHRDRRRHRNNTRQNGNAILNLREMLDGSTVLESTPPQLGIDMYGECNIKPPCVYCSWDESKTEEGANVDVPFTSETLGEWAEFFDNSRNLVNCSIGEPFMMKNFDELLDIFGDDGKAVEITTNGQILTDRTIEKLLFRNIELYISLDAATPETFAKLRNNHFLTILDNLRRLVKAKGGPGRWPKIYLVFMPMRANAHELDDFVALCADLNVDRLILRPLNWKETSDLNWDRGGYRFNYVKELLPFDELVRISGRTAELAAGYGLEVSDQLDFGGTPLRSMFEQGFDQGRREVTPAAVASSIQITPPDVLPEPPATVPAETQTESSSQPLPPLGDQLLPICTEPWKSLYILRRGTLPCCHGSPVADVDEYRQAWNSPLLQEIRASLSEGQFHTYCLDAPSCPIVRKALEARQVEPSVRLFLRARTVWRKIDNACGGIPGRFYHPLKRWLGKRSPA